MKRLANRPPEAQPAGPEKIRSAHGSLRVLIVDDEALARQGIRMLLDQDADISLIEEVRNGKQAADLMQTGGFDLIFLDVQMKRRSQ